MSSKSIYPIDPIAEFLGMSPLYNIDYSTPEDAVNESMAGELHPLYGTSMSEESKARISATQKERFKDPSTQTWITGRKHSAESIAKMRESSKGPLSEEHKKSLSEAGKGRVHSDETKQKMSESMQGRKNALGSKRSAEQLESYKVGSNHSTTTPCPHCDMVGRPNVISLHMKKHHTEHPPYKKAARLFKTKKGTPKDPLKDD